MKKNIVIILLVFLTILNISALATIAYQRITHAGKAPPPQEPPPEPGKRMIRYLGLNEEQANAFHANHERLKKETEPIFTSMEAKRKELMDETAVEQPDIEKINNLIEEIGTLEIALKKKTITNMLALKSILTPEQQKKFFSRFHERRGRMGFMKHRGKGMGRGHRFHRPEKGVNDHDIKSFGPVVVPIR